MVIIIKILIFWNISWSCIVVKEMVYDVLNNIEFLIKSLYIFLVKVVFRDVKWCFYIFEVWYVFI